MSTLSRIFLWLTHKISVALLANAVAVAIPLYAIGVHITNPEVPKDWLARTDTYQTIIEESVNLIEIESATASSDGSLGDSLNSNPFIDGSAITTALVETIDPAYIQSETEELIDGVYPWLRNEVDVPQFEFSLEAKQSELNQRLINTFEEEFAKLPECTPEELGEDFDILQSLCIPPNVNLASEVRSLATELSGENGLLDGAAWTGEDLIERTEGGEGLSESEVAYAQNAFRGFSDGPIIFLIAGFLSIPLILLTSRSRYNGVHEIGYTLFSGSLFVFVTSFVLSRYEGIIANFIGETGSTEGSIQAARNIFEPFLEAVVGDIATLTAQLSGAVLVVGTIMVGYGVYERRKHREEEEAAAIAELKAAQVNRQIKKIKKVAKKHPKKYADKTLDPETKKPLKHSDKKITVHHARKIARHPDYKSKKVSDLAKEE